MTSMLYGHRDGETYTPDDYDRLNKQAIRVWQQMYGRGWVTLREISDATGDGEASVSARMRDFRKPRFGEHIVDRESMGDGVFRYRLRWRKSVTPPTLEEIEAAWRKRR